MSERWKFQLKTGLPFGIYMGLFMTGFDAWMNHSFDVFLRWNFLVKMAYWMLSGIFLMGYIFWRQKIKAEKK